MRLGLVMFRLGQFRVELELVRFRPRMVGVGVGETEMSRGRLVVFLRY